MSLKVAKEPPLYDLDHLKRRNSPWAIKENEALLLFSITKMVSPKVIVEFGTHTGYSTINFLKAMDYDSKIYTFDLEKYPQIDLIEDKRLKFIQKDQTNFSLSDIDDNFVDLLFIDCSHIFENNLKTFELISPRLKDNSIIVLHDTAFCAGQFGEIQFATWLSGSYSRIDFHCDAKDMWGISVFQKKF